MAHRMATTVEQLAEDKVKLTVDVPAHDVHHAVEHAANDLAASVRIPGFRRGKVPMPILLQRVGKERVYSEAVESHIGGWFLSAATRARVNPIAQPAYDYELPASESEDWRFSATVEVQPKPEPADWTQLEVPKHEGQVPQDAVQAELEALQRTVGELVPVEGRPAQDGDTVVVDLIAEDGTAQRDYIVELGSERLVEEIENGIRGLGAGESREIAYELQDAASRKATVVVKELKEHILPPLDDELAKTATECDSLGELRADIEDRLLGQIQEELDGLFRAAAVDELVRASNVRATGPLVEARTRELLTGLARSLEARGIDANTYLELTGQSIEQLNARLYAEASLSVGRELIL
jgi:trigger factor